MKIDHEAFTDSIELSQDLGQVWRGKIFDQSARCETRLRLIHENDLIKEVVPHQFKALAISARKFGESDARYEKLTKIIDELLPLIELRSQLAHSVLRLAHVDEIQCLMFTYNSGDHKYGQKIIMLNSQQQDNAVKKLTNLANRLKAFQKRSC